MMENNQPTEPQQLIREELLLKLELLKREIDATNNTQMDRLLKIYGALKFMTESTDANTIAISSHRSHQRRIEYLELLLGVGGSVGMGQTVNPQPPQNPQASAQAAQPEPTAPPDQVSDFQIKTPEQVLNKAEQIRAKAESNLHRPSYPQASRPPQ
jgi:hypothetical protein